MARSGLSISLEAGWVRTSPAALQSRSVSRWLLLPRIHWADIAFPIVAPNSSAMISFMRVASHPWID